MKRSFAELERIVLKGAIRAEGKAVLVARVHQAYLPMEAKPNSSKQKGRDKSMKSDWKERFEQAAMAFHRLKGLTKKIPASEWTPEYGELAELVHTLRREVFYVNPDDYEAQPGGLDANSLGNRN